MNIFAQIVKKGLTFTTDRGSILPQDIYNLPLTGNNGFNLDSISRGLLKAVRDTGEESLVSAPTQANSDDELRIEVLKYIIADKQEEATVRQEQAKKQLRKQQLQQLIAKKAVEADESTSMEDLEKELAELG